MKNRLSWLLLILPISVGAQVLRVTGSQLIEKPINSAQPVEARLQSLRIENNKVWINGNLFPVDKLPYGMRKLDPNVNFYASFNGIPGIELQLEGRNYLIRAQKVCDITRIHHCPNTNNPQEEKYFTKLNQEDPETFQALTEESKLNQEANDLSRLYGQLSDMNRKAEIKTQLTVVLGKLFDLSIENQEKELQFLQQQIEIRKAEINLKRNDKTKVIAKNLGEMTQISR